MIKELQREIETEKRGEDGGGSEEKLIWLVSVCLRKQDVSIFLHVPYVINSDEQQWK